jgi:hypothetical protein
MGNGSTDMGLHSFFACRKRLPLTSPYRIRPVPLSCPARFARQWQKSKQISFLGKSLVAGW